MELQTGWVTKPWSHAGEGLRGFGTNIEFTISIISKCTFTMLCHHYHYPTSRTFQHFKWSLGPHETLTSHSPPQPMVTFILLSVSMNLTVLSTLHKGNYTLCVLYIWLVSLGLTFLRFIHGVPCIGISFLFIAEYCSIHLLIDTGCFHFLTVVFNSYEH